jgi:dienelactone hydrolase
MKYIGLFILIITLSVVLTSLRPEKDYAITPAEFGVKYSEVSFKTKDGLNLKGWFFSPEKKSGTIVVLSHDGEGNMSSMIEIASNFTSLGYNVLTYDYRGFGGSDDFKINNQFVIYPQFAKDLDAAIDFAHASYEVNQVFLYGKGIGASLSICAASGRRDVQKAIADSPYDELNNYQKLIKEIKGEDIMIPLAYDKSQLDPQFALSGKYAKTSQYLIINGAEDQLCSVKILKSLAKINPDNVQLNTVKKADYSTTFSSDKTAYFKVISEFLK